MDHVPKPPGSYIAPIEVPLLAKLKYDFDGFDSFPYRHGFIKDGKLDRFRSLDELTALMQSWLYFGLISEYIGKPINTEDFTYYSASAGCTMVSSSCLFDLLNAWNCRLRQLRMISPSWKEAVTATKSLLLIAERANRKFDYLPGLSQPRYAAIALSTKVLLITLFSVYNTLLPDTELDIDAFHLRPRHDFHDLTMPQPAQYLREVLKVRGWCPALIQRIFKRHDYYVVMFLAQIPRNEPVDIIHAHCSATACRGYNVSENTYQIRHVNDSCQCPTVSVPTDRIANLIQNGQIPLVKISMTPSPILSVIPAMSGNSRESQSERYNVSNQHGPFRKYVAISHVWADGMGNPRSNALPQCQVARIAKLVLPQKRYLRKERNEHVLIWMDTFCIPVGQQYNAIRLKAIEQMALIFASAYDVLVLDRNLMQLHVPPIDRIERSDPPAIGLAVSHPLYLRRQSFYVEWAEVFGRILSSPWAGRSWTLQEAVIPQHVQFALRDGIMTSQWIDAAAVSPTTSMDLHRDGENSSSLLSSLRMSFIRILSTGFQLCCVPQLYTRCRVLTVQIWSTKESRDRDHYMTCLIGFIYLILASIASLEITILHLLYILTVLLGTCVVAIPLGVLFGILALLAMSFSLPILSKADCRWLQARLRSNRLEDILGHMLFMNLARAARDMLHLDSKAMVVATRGSRDLLDRAHSSRFAHVWNSLSDRSTTKPEDLHYILSILTDRRVRSLKNIASDERMESILRTFKYIPAHLLFTFDAQTTARIVSNDQWLPATPKSGPLDDGPLLRVLPNGFELYSGEQERDATIYINKCNSSTEAEFAILFGEDMVEYYEVEILRRSEASPRVPQAGSQYKTCSMMLGAPKKRLEPPDCFHILQFEILNQMQSSLELRLESLLRLQRLEPDRAPIPVVSYIDLKETLPQNIKCLISHAWPAKTLTNDADNDQHEHSDPNGPSDQPAFGLTATLAHYTLLRLVNINLAVLFVPIMVILAYRDIDPARIVGIVIVGLCWLLAASEYMLLRAECLSIAWHAHYDIVDPSVRSNLVSKLSVFMGKWDRAIASNFPLSGADLTDLRDGWVRPTASPEQVLADPRRRESLLTYLLPFVGSEGLDVENRTGDMTLAAEVADSFSTPFNMIGLAKPTLKASLESRFSWPW